MLEREEAEVTVELVLDSLDASGRRHLLAGAHGRWLAVITAAEEQDRLRVTVDPTDEAPTWAEWQALVRAITAWAQGERCSRVVLPADSRLLLRNAARSSGFVGPLRGELTRDFLVPQSPGSAVVVGAGAAVGLEDRFFSGLNSLLPGMTVAPAKRPAGWLRSAMRSAAAGVGDTIHLTVRDAGEGKPLALAVPLGRDVLVEGVAMAIDTAMAVRRRFYPLVDRVRIFYDQSVHGLRTGTVAGLADAYVRDIHLNPAFARAGELEILDRQLGERRRSAEAEQPPPRTFQPPFTRIDSVVAHELWHQIEFGLESARYRDSVEFRRAVGSYFGVETIEHAIKGDSIHAPMARRVARTRLAEEVSAYATTGPKEATAELFTQWWCTRGAPPPSAVYFGQVVARFFPPPAPR